MRFFFTGPTYMFEGDHVIFSMKVVVDTDGSFDIVMGVPSPKP